MKLFDELVATVILLHLVAAVGSDCRRSIDRLHVLVTRSKLEKQNVHCKRLVRVRRSGTDRRACRCCSDGAGSTGRISKSMKLFKEEHAEKSALRRRVAVTGFIDISNSWTRVIFVEADGTLPEEQSFNTVS